jgi:hypothetical protein
MTVDREKIRQKLQFMRERLRELRRSTASGKATW